MPARSTHDLSASGARRTVAYLIKSTWEPVFMKRSVRQSFILSSRGTWSAALAVGLLVLGGCYSYTPVQTPARGTIARVTLPARSAIEGVRGTAGTTAAVEGEVLSAGDTIVLGMRSVREWGPDVGSIRIDTVRIPRQALSVIERKELSITKSTAAGAVLVGTVVAVSLLLDIRGSKQGDVPFDGTDLPEGAIISLSISSIIAKLFGGGP